jgi:hypothetical protein
MTTDDGPAPDPTAPIDPTDPREQSMRVRGDRVTWRRVDDEAILLDLRRSEYLSLNRSATVLWEALVVGSDHDGLTEMLCRRYGLERTVAAEDVAVFLALCDEHGFLDRSGEG